MSTFTPIASLTLSTDLPSVVFSNISQGYSDLVVSIVHANTTSTNADILFRFNNDTSASYSFSRLFAAEGAAATGSTDRSSNVTYIAGAWAPGTNSGSTNFATSRAEINGYSNTTTYKTVATSMDTASSVNKVAGQTIGLWRNTAAITTITLTSASGSIRVGSTINIYGIANAGITNVAKATGGDSVYTDGTYWYHTFLSSGTFTPTQSLTADYLVVAGGGGASGDRMGGGGAGGYRTSIGGSALSLIAQAYAVTVGAGGAGVSSGTSSNGGNSSFSGVTSAGGGRGGDPTTATLYTAGSGGSGGGTFGVSGNQGSGNTPSTSPSQGNGGGYGVYPPTNQGSGGGGGAGAAGANQSSGNGGAGGIGIANSISGSSVYYAGGGGGGGYPSGAVGGTGGNGGGGNGGAYLTAGTSGTANTGGGAGCSGGNSTTATNGGSGIVIVRYAV